MENDLTMITQKRLLDVLRYEADTGVFTWKKRLSSKAGVGDKAGVCDTQGRLLIRIDNKLYLAHRLVWLYVHGRWPEHVIDHINCDPSDNRLCNLREATSGQNSSNMRAHVDNPTGIKGVSFDKSRGKWLAQICHRGLHKFLGRFENIDQAKEAYAKASAQYHGEYGRV